MLTFILLVVLAGGVGLAAVSAAERTDPATSRARTRRGDPPRPAAVSELPRRSRRGDVPRARTAVEGAFATVAIARSARRVTSLVILVALTIGLAVVIAGAVGLVAAA